MNPGHALMRPRRSASHAASVTVPHALRDLNFQSVVNYFPTTTAA